VIGVRAAFAVHELYSDIRDIGRRLGVAHVVEGSVRKAGNRVRVSARLINASTSHQLWAEQYDRNLGDIFAVQDEITDVIVTTLAGRIEQSMCERAAEKPACDMVAYDHLLRARELIRKRSHHEVLAARFHLDRALELDPTCAAAYATYAINYVFEYESTWCQDRATVIDRAYALACKAVTLDETDSFAHMALAHAANYCGQGELALRAIDRSVQLNRYDYPNRCIRAWIAVLSGHPAEALEDLNEARRFNPLGSESCLITIGIAEYMAALYREASETFTTMSSWDAWRYPFLAACYAQLGMSKQAHITAEKVVNSAATEFASAENPLDRWRAFMRSIFPFRNEEDRARFVDGLCKAGLPIDA
jgi:adenylate cyclase